MSKIFFVVLFTVVSITTVFQTQTVFASSQLTQAIQHEEVVHFQQQNSLSYCVTVQPGDWLSKLFPSNWRSVAVANNISNPNLIYPGQRICDTSSNSELAYTTYKPAVTYSGGSPNHYPWGWCTWGAANLAWDNVDWLGNAKDWYYNAKARGMLTGFTPSVGATVVFQAYVQGASYLGHVAHVTAVYGNGSFQVREMNNTYLGGFGIYNYNVYWTGWGVSFIY